ncbi:glycosyltransferase WbuB [Tepidanaerobacter syntrophicus]|uniref:glycosyltransferase family 4 protein n=1 Tax=Tepidanaerobacter syntrophicus TaxID=224999 RepID=UPI0022EDCFC9|nr:glycosyltransferase family 4 protein [Tepidanaerobacter syntrophicus]GLI51891.1 glycosyltransferase WbuB [Tepidanaerobacter syntrophicus]
MKNIWILNHYAKPYGGRHYKFAENLIKRGYNVKIFCASTVHNSNQNMITDSRKYLYELHNDIPFVIIRARSYKGNGAERIKNMIDYAAGLMSVSKKFDTEKPDVIYASSVHPLTWLAGYKLSKRYGAKFIAETRDLWPETFVAMGKMSKNSIPAKILYKIEKFIYQKADKLIFTFPGGKDYVESIGLDSSKVRYINNGVDLEEFNQNKTRYVLEDEDLDDDSTFKVLFTGAIGEANAIYRIVDVAKIFIDKGIEEIKFYIFGDGPEKEKLQNRVQEDKVTNVIFKGKVDKRYVPSILSRADLNIFCFEYLPNLFKYGLSPNKMFDYFASGHPIVSNVECGYDMLEKYKCGITVKGGSAEALAEGILKFYNMPKEEYNTYCENALKAAQDFDFKVLTDKLEKIILED